MASASWKENPDLNDNPTAEVMELFRKEPYQFSFFQAVRLLHHIGVTRKAVGNFAQPSAEAVRFSVNSSLAFPASEIQGIEWPEDAPPKMIVNFMGLTGPIGALPLYYTEFVADRARNRDMALRDFLDIFNHRMISLFYRAWQKHQFAAGYAGDAAHLTSYILDLIGIGTPGLQDRQGVPDKTLTFYCGLLARQSKSVSGLENMIGDYFDIPVEVEDFIGVWRRLDISNQCLLEEDESCSLGSSAIVGDEVFDNSRVRIRLGPLTIEQYNDFLPNGDAYGAVRALTKAFSTEVEYELQLVLREADVLGCVLGTGLEAQPLGWLTWIRSTQQPSGPRSDTILLLD
jgi:type VI secretion system protein ImpH